MASPLLIGLLRSPLRRLRSRHTIVIRSGAEAVATRYHRDGDAITVLGEEDTTWWRGPTSDDADDLEVLIDGHWRPATARTLSGDALDKAMIAYLHANPGEWRRLGVGPRDTADDVAGAAKSVAVIQLSLR